MVEILIGQQILKDNLYLMNQMQVMVVLVWGKAVPELTGANVSFAVRARVTILRDLGAALSPDNAFGLFKVLKL